MNMKNLLLTSVALIFVSTSGAFATTNSEHSVYPTMEPTPMNLDLMADKGGGNSGSGGGNDGGNHGADHDSGDDHGGASGNDDNDNDDDADDNDNDDDNASGRKKPRIPGGSGCDSASDQAEHGGCSAG
jgi:hypothetical protein